MTNKKLIAIIAFILIFSIFVPTAAAFNLDQGFSSLMTVTDDGYLEKGEPSLRVVDYDLATRSVPNETFVEGRLVVANYGTEEINSMTIDHKLNHPDKASPIDPSNYQVQPSKSYTISLEPGEHKILTYRYKFFTSVDYKKPYNLTVYRSDTGSGVPTNLPIANKSITVTEEGSKSDEALFINRESVNKSRIAPTEFKHERSDSDNIVYSNFNIPPVDTAGRSVDDIDVAKGNIVAFKNIRNKNSDSATEFSKHSSGDMRLGFKYDNINEREHYGLEIEYEFKSEPDISELNNFELKVVDSIGQEIDENTTYHLNKFGSGVRKDSIQFSKKEVEYIKSKGNVYVVLDGGINNDIDMYTLNLVAANDVFDLPSSDLSASVSASPSTVTVGERVSVSAEITNDGSSRINKKFQLFEANNGEKISGESFTDEKITINPGQTKTISISTTIDNEDHNEFMILDDTTTITVNDNDISQIDPSIDVSPSTSKVGQSITFTASGVSGELGNIKELEWYLDGDDNPEVDKSGGNIVMSDMTQDYTFSSEGSKTVELKLEYERDDGSVVDIETSRTVQIVSEPEPNMKNVVFDFVVDDQQELSNYGGSYTIGSTLRGTLSSSSCENSCSSTINVLSDKPTTDGINMLVLEANREDLTFSEEFYGAYNVSDGSGYATTTSPDSMNRGSFKSDLKSGSNPSTKLKNDISTYKSSSDEYYFILTSGGSPVPASNSADLYNGLGQLGAKLGQGKTCNLGSSCQFQNNAMWTFVSKTGDNVVPLHETYRQPVDDSDQLQHSFKIVPTVVKGTDVPRNRAVYHDIKDATLFGDLDEAQSITWNVGGDYINDKEIIKTNAGASSPYTVEVSINDKLGGNTGSQTNSINPGTYKPNASIGNSTIITGESSSLYAENPTDLDTSVVDYDWIIEKPSGGSDVTLSGSSVEHTFTELGKYTIKLQIEDTNDNTRTITKEVNPEAGPPAVTTDINSVPVRYNTENSDNGYSGYIEPSVHYTMEDTVGDTLIDVTGKTNGDIKDGVSTSSGISGDALSFDGSSNSKVVVKDTSELDVKEMSISMWIKPDTLSGTQTILSRPGAYSLRIDGGNLKFSTSSASDNSVSTTTLEKDKWNHIALGTDPYNNEYEIYINGSKKNEITAYSFEPNINTNSNLIIGHDGSNGFEGDIDDLRLYNAKIKSNVINSIMVEKGTYSPTAEPSYPIYNKGDQFKTISKYSGSGQGSVSFNSNSIIMTTDSTNGNNASRYIQTEKLDMSKYDEIHLSYKRNFDRKIARGHEETGYVSMHTKSDVDGDFGTEGVDRFTGESGVVGDVAVNHFSDGNAGTLELDVSSYSNKRRVYVRLKSFGSNKGNGKVEISQMIGFGYDKNNPTPAQLFESGLHPAKSPHRARYDTGIGGVKLNSPIYDPSVSSGSTTLISSAVNSGSVEFEYKTENTVSSFEAYGGSSFNIGTKPTMVDSIVTESDGINSGVNSIGPNTYDSFALESTVGKFDNMIELEKLRVTTDNTNGNYPIIEFDARNTNAVGEGNYIKSYEWDLDASGGTFNTDKRGSRIVHEFNSLGTKTVKLRVTDKNGKQNIVERTVDVNNLEPEITTVIDINGQTGEDLRFKHSINSNPGSSVQKVAWILGNGEVRYVDPGKELTYSYPKSGEYKVKAVAIDQYGLTGVDTETVRVTPNLPDLSKIPDDIQAHVKDTILLTGSDSGTSGDPDLVTTEYDASSLEDGYSGSINYLWKTPDGSEHNSKVATYQENTLTGLSNSKNISLTITNSFGEQDIKNISISTFNNGPQIEIISDGYASVTDGGDDATHIDRKTNVYLRTTHSSPRVDVDTEFNITDSKTLNPTIDPADNEKQVTTQFKQTFTPDKSKYTKSDFPVHYKMNATIEDEFGETNSTGNYDMEVTHRGINIDDLAILKNSGDEKNQEINILIMADVSGSMSGSRWDNVKSATAEFANNLPEDYNFGFGAFGRFNPPNAAAMLGQPSNDYDKDAELGKYDQLSGYNNFTDYINDRKNSGLKRGSRDGGLEGSLNDGTGNNMWDVAENQFDHYNDTPSGDFLIVMGDGDHYDKSVNPQNKDYEVIGMYFDGGGDDPNHIAEVSSIDAEYYDYDLSDVTHSSIDKGSYNTGTGERETKLRYYDTRNFNGGYSDAYKGIRKSVVGGQVRHNMSVSGPDFDSDDVEYKFTIDHQGSATEVTSGWQSDEEFLHEYQKVGTYDVKLQARETKYGFTATSSHEIETESVSGIVRVKPDQEVNID